MRTWRTRSRQRNADTVRPARQGELTQSDPEPAALKTACSRDCGRCSPPETFIPSATGFELLWFHFVFRCPTVTHNLHPPGLLRTAETVLSTGFALLLGTSGHSSAHGEVRSSLDKSTLPKRKGFGLALAAALRQLSPPRKRVSPLPADVKLLGFKSFFCFFLF